MTVDGAPLAFEPGDTVAIAVLRAGLHPGRGGTLCLAGDCPNCLCVVDGVSYVRACQTPARAGSVIARQGAGGVARVPDPGDGATIPLRHVHCDVAVVGRGESGRGAAAEARAAGREVVEIDAVDGSEAVGIYDGPRLVVRRADGMLHVHAREVVVATGAAEGQPACEGSDLEGLYTARAGATLEAAGLLPGRVVRVAGGARPVRFEGEGRVRAVVVRAADGTEQRHEADAVVLDLGLHPRDGLARQGAGLAVRTVGEAAGPDPLPPPPIQGVVVCRCTGTTVADLDSVWDRGFREMELLKRSTLAGTGTCQGSACLPHLRAYLAARSGEVPAPFTARPMTRQLTMEEAAGGIFFPPVRRTALDAEHRALGARMERFGGWWRPWTYGDTDREYRAVREAVSIGDVSTLGKVIVSGPDAVRFLERIYPCRVGDLAPGRIRYALLLDERGYVFDDGVIVRDGERRFTLTFTTGGAAGAEAWLRDWAEGFECDVRILDRTVAVAAINVTGPRAAELLGRCGLADPPAFMRAAAGTVAGVRCDVMRLGFTGEPSWELHHPADRSVDLWRALLEAGSDLGVRPHGLQALLALRLEKGHVIVGMDTDFDSTPRRLGMEWAVRSDGVRDFIGGDALTRIDTFPLDRRLVALEMDGPAPVDGSPIFDSGALRGNVTSAWFSAVLGRTVLLAFADLVGGVLPTAFHVDGRTARVVELPFYDREGVRVRA
ncbi:MAG: aminomethyltransferase [Gaiellaceae bacterium]|nr:aminomethyltransferase [Gaiellaceae bacterium]